MTQIVIDGQLSYRGELRLSDNSIEVLYAPTADDAVKSMQALVGAAVERGFTDEMDVSLRGPVLPWHIDWNASLIVIPHATPTYEVEILIETADGMSTHSLVMTNRYEAESVVDILRSTGSVRLAFSQDAIADSMLKIKGVALVTRYDVKEES